MVEIPFPLKHAMETGECVLFLGAGVGFNLLDLAGKNAPTASQLARELAELVGVDTKATTDLSRIAKIVELRKGRTHLETFLRKRLSDLEPDEAYKWLFTRRWKAIFTTNYDDSIRTTYGKISKPLQNPVVIRSTSELTDFNPYIEVPVYYLHGALHSDQDFPLVVTVDDYPKFRETRRMLFEILKKEFATSTILYIGYSNSDPNWDLVLSEITEEFGMSHLPKAYRVAPSTNPLDDEILSSKNIETIDATLEEFYDTASKILDDSRDNGLERKRNKIPHELLPVFDKSPAAVTRLLSSWTFVNRASFDERPNLEEYLDGNKPNWGLIASGMIFQRDIEDEIHTELLDYATSRKDKPSAKAILAPAGYGVTTLLMTLAARLVEAKAGPVFMLKAGQTPQEGDIDFACSIFETRPFFVIDNATDRNFMDTINKLITRFSQDSRPILFLLGERLNEWRQAHRTPLATEFLIEPLSDPEIHKLLDYLESHSKLNRLADLDEEMRFAVIRNKHQKELLVAMKEATEGRSFDAIIEDEFIGIEDDKAQRLYLIVCCLYQYGTLVRTGLLSEMLDISETQLYQRTNASVEGVVIYETLNEDRGYYAARARHRTIAEIVWERCSNYGEREQILQSALAALNLNYGIDKSAFEHLVKSDRMIDDIATLDGRIQFFDMACRKDPGSPYVRQHYARMFLRSEKPDSALRLIDEAIKLDPDKRVLYHTKAHILKELALNVEGDEIARRWLVQSEENYRRGINMSSRDDYSYQGLAELYFGWAKRSEQHSEQALYLARAEETITEGLSNVHNRESLWIVSAEIQNWLGNQPERIEALETAVQESPNSVYPRYLLGRAYRKKGQPLKTLEILRPVIQQNFYEVRCFVEYAVALIKAGKSYREAIATLELSRTSGLRDPRYIATLGGMLFMNKEFKRAEEVFAETSRRNFTSREKLAIQFQPPDPDNLLEILRLSGKVTRVYGHYCFIGPDDYPDFFCPGTKYNGIRMMEGLQIVFEPSFTAKGNIANNPIVVNKP